MVRWAWRYLRQADILNSFNCRLTLDCPSLAPVFSKAPVSNGWRHAFGINGGFDIHQHATRCERVA